MKKFCCHKSTALLLKLQTVFLISMATILSSKRKCKLNPNVFCYICGSFTVSKQRQGITEFVKKAYLAYFRVKLGDQDKNWAPHQVCRTCVENLRQWTKQKRKTIGFAVPIVWREQANHVNDCYFCMTNGTDFSSKSTLSTQTFHQQSGLYLTLLIFLHLCLLPCLN